MTLYLHLPNQKGTVTTQGYEGWIEANVFSFAAEREIRTTPGNTANRICSHVLAHEMYILKPIDITSPFFFSEACTGRAISEIKIDITADNLPTMQYILENVLVSEYDSFMVGNNPPVEAIAFNFTHLEMRYLSRESDGVKPVSAKVQTGSRPSHAAQLKRSIFKRSDEGFKLFVATVYGEACNSSEIAWQAVASTIINRVDNRHFRVGPRHHQHRLATPEKVITQPLWYEAYDTKSPEYLHADNYLRGKTTHKPPHIDRMVVLLKPIYYGNRGTTDADHYFSPHSQAMGHAKNSKKYKAKIPRWVREGLATGELEELVIPFLHDDFRFFRTVPYDRRKLCLTQNK